MAEIKTKIFYSSYEAFEFCEELKRLGKKHTCDYEVGYMDEFSDRPDLERFTVTYEV